MNNTQQETSQNPQLLLNQIVLEYMDDKRRQRKWRMIKWIAFFLFLAWFAYQIFDINSEDTIAKNKSHVGVIDINGAIFEGTAGSSENFASSLSDAYKAVGLKALILRINSPGGSPVQAEYMYNAIQYYRKKHPDVKVYAVCVDACASAAYYIAAAADEIYASPSSLIGSIGVLYNGFGFADLLQKVGVTRRLHTSGVNKSFLDPFSPENPEQTEKLQVMLDKVHQQFINRVKEGRGSRLKISDELFSGLFWTGEQAEAMGLIDGFSSPGQLAREKLQIEDVIDYTNKESLFERFAKNIGIAFVDQVPSLLGVRPGFQ